MTHSIHDFKAKLRQPSVAPALEGYVKWRRGVRAARERGEAPPPAPELAPVSINLDLTTACNFRCTHCIDWDILNTKHRLAEADLRDSITLLRERGLRSVILIGGGEPTLYPGFVDFVGFLKEAGLMVAVVTNGSRGDRLHEAIAFLEEGDWIRMSLDAGSNELFQAMHLPTSAAVTLDGICDWVPKLKAKNPKPRLGFSYIIIWGGASREGEVLHENIDEIELATERAKRSGFDYIALKPVLERQENGAEVMDPDKSRAAVSDTVARIRRQVDAAKVHADASFEVYESTNLRMLEEGTWRDLTHQPQTCHMQALRQVLTPTGLYNCPAHRGVDKGLIAAKDAYQDAERAEGTGVALAAILDRFDASVECKAVTCLYHSTNWWLEELIASDEEPQLASGTRDGDFFL